MNTVTRLGMIGALTFSVACPGLCSASTLGNLINSRLSKANAQYTAVMKTVSTKTSSSNSAKKTSKTSTSTVSKISSSARLAAADAMYAAVVKSSPSYKTAVKATSVSRAKAVNSFLRAKNIGRINCW